MSAGTELGAWTLSRSDVLHAVRHAAMPTAVSSRPAKLLCDIGVMDVCVRRSADFPALSRDLVAKANTENDRHELRVFRLVRANSVTHATRVAEAVLGIESSVLGPHREVAPADRYRQRLRTEIVNRPRWCVEGESDLAQLCKVRRFCPVVLQLTTVLRLSDDRRRISLGINVLETGSEDLAHLLVVRVSLFETPLEVDHDV